MTPSSILEKARALIKDPENWTQGAYGRDQEGEVVSAYAHGAVCWCSLGALKKVSDEGTTAENEWAARKYLRAVIGMGIPYYNDHHLTTHSDILERFTQAIELARKDQQ